MSIFDQGGQRVEKQVHIGMGPMLSERTRAKVDVISSHLGLSAEAVLLMAIEDLYLCVFGLQMDKEVTGE